MMSFCVNKSHQWLQLKVGLLIIKVIRHISQIFFFEKILEDMSFSWGHWYPCFGLRVTSVLGFKARVDPFCVLSRLCDPQIRSPESIFKQTLKEPAMKPRDESETASQWVKLWPRKNAGHSENMVVNFMQVIKPENIKSRLTVAE